jgi:hypothetical protein
MVLRVVVLVTASLAPALDLVSHCRDCHLPAIVSEAALGHDCDGKGHCCLEGCPEPLVAVPVTADLCLPVHHAVAELATVPYLRPVLSGASEERWWAAMAERPPDPRFPLVLRC